MCESGFPAHDNECVVKCKSTLSVKRNSHRYLLQPRKGGGKIFSGYVLLRVQIKIWDYIPVVNHFSLYLFLLSLPKSVL